MREPVQQHRGRHAWSDPALRSRGNVQKQARDLADDPDFRRQIEELIRGEPAGSLVVPTLAAALERIAQLEERLERLEARVGMR